LNKVVIKVEYQSMCPPTKQQSKKVFIVRQPQNNNPITCVVSLRGNSIGCGPRLMKRRLGNHRGFLGLWKNWLRVWTEVGESSWPEVGSVVWSVLNGEGTWLIRMNWVCRRRLGLGFVCQRRVGFPHSRIGELGSFLLPP
jgi:hypothetical protein